MQELNLMYGSRHTGSLTNPVCRKVACFIGKREQTPAMYHIVLIQVVGGDGIICFDPRFLNG